MNLVFTILLLFIITYIKTSKEIKRICIQASKKDKKIYTNTSVRLIERHQQDKSDDLGFKKSNVHPELQDKKTPI